MSKYRLPFLYVLLMLLPFAGNSQELSYRHYTTADGLAGNHAYHSIQARDGYICFATETGVSRFDGARFKNYSTADGLPDNEIIRLFEDSKGRIWMMPFNDQLCFYKDGFIHNASNDSLLAKINLRERVVDIFEDTNRNIFIMEGKNLVVLNPFDKILERKEPNLTFERFFVSGGVNQNGEALIASFALMSGATGLIYKVNFNEEGFMLQLTNLDVRFWGNRSNFCPLSKFFFAYPNNEASMFKTDESIVFHYSRQRFDTLQLKGNFNSYAPANDSLTFICSDQGVFAYNFYQQAYTNNYLNKENASFAFYDHEKNLWITTLGNGVFRQYSNAIRNIVFIDKQGSVAPVHSVFLNKKDIFCGSISNTIYRLNRESGKISTLQFATTRPQSTVIKMAPFGQQLFIVNHSSLLLSDTLLGHLNELTYKELYVTYKDMFYNHNNELYLATHLKSVKTKAGKEESVEELLDERSTAIYNTDSGTYIGTLKGLLFVHRDKRVKRLYEQYPLLKCRVSGITAWDNRIWVSSSSNGMVCYQPGKPVFNIGREQGLASNLVRTVYANGSKLWVGTDAGVSKLNMAEGKEAVEKTYRVSDGLADNIINGLFEADGVLYVGTVKGLTVINENQFVSASSCLLRLNKITVSDKRVDINQALRISSSNNNIRFDFTAISFKAEGDVTYFYKLSAADNQWRSTKQPFLFYPALPPGEYKMSLYAVNKFGVKSNLVEYTFEVEKKWFQHWAVLFLASLLILGIIWMLVVQRIAFIRRKEDEKRKNAEKIAWLEQQALKAQMNPHFIFNCLNSIQQYVIEKDVAGANKFISGFASLIRQTLDQSGKQMITVAEEVHFLKSYLELEKSRFENKFDYQIHFATSVDKEQDELPPMLLQPFVENAIRHGIMHKNNGKGMIDINFDKQGPCLFCTVTDNGIGRAEAAKYRPPNSMHQSKGISITGQRIQMMSKVKVLDIVLSVNDIKNEAGMVCGTQVLVKIPLQNP